MADGLDALDARRKRSSRSIPPSRTGARAAAVTIAKPALEPPSVDLRTSDDESPALAPEPTPIRQKKPGAASKPAPAATEQLLRTTMFLGPSEDNFLESIRSIGRRSTPKVDATRSAVARLAISRLEEQLSAEEIIAELAKSSTSSSPGGGRPRR